jgi:hypothetical protein
LAGDDNSVAMGLLFYPRGGSALVAAYLSRALIARGWHVTLACGSLGPEGALGNATTFFAGIDTVPVAYDEAVARWERGADPMDAPFPMHPSYEEREGAPDRSFPRVTPEQGERMVTAWAGLIAGSAALGATVGSVLGPFVAMGLSEEEAEHCAGKFRRGHLT